MTASSGAILDGQGDSLASPDNNITADDLVLSATSGIGTGTDAGFIETKVTNLEASGGTGGGVFLINDGDLEIGGIGSMSGVSASGDDIRIAAESKLTVSEPVTNPGGKNILLRRTLPVTGQTVY